MPLERQAYRFVLHAPNGFGIMSHKLLAGVNITSPELAALFAFLGFPLFSTNQATYICVYVHIYIYIYIYIFAGVLNPAEIN